MQINPDHLVKESKSRKREREQSNNAVIQGGSFKNILNEEMAKSSLAGYAITQVGPAIKNRASRRRNK